MKIYNSLLLGKLLRDHLKILLFFIPLLFSQSIFAHSASGCSHTHDGSWDTSIDCDIRNEACTINNTAGTCTTVVSTFWRDCRCKTKKKGQIFEGLLIGGKLDQLPTEFGTSTIVLRQEQHSGFYISDGNLTSELLSKYFITGSMELRFGSFVNPRKVPVEFTNVDFTIENYLFNDRESGSNKYGLNVQSNQKFYFDTESQIIQSDHFEENLVLNLENDFVGFQEINFGLMALVDQENYSVELRTQGYYELPKVPSSLSLSKGVANIWQGFAILGFLIIGFYFIRMQ